VWSRVVIDSETGSHPVFLFRRMLQVLRCTLRDSLTGLDLWGTCGESGIEQSDVEGDHERRNNPSFWDERDHMASVPDASPMIDPWWIQRCPESRASAKRSRRPPGKLEIGGFRNDHFLKVPCLRPWWSTEGYPYCGFGLAPSSSWFKDELVEFFIASSNWMYG